MQRSYIRHRQIQRKHLRNSRILTTIFLAIISIIIVGIFFTSSVEASKVINYNDLAEVKTVIVSEGDSLWSLAEEKYPLYKGDIRELIYEIKKFNNLSNGNIYTGQKLYLPCCLS